MSQEYPLLVAAAMARAYRSGEKTQTRRQVKPHPPSECTIHYMLGAESWLPPEKQTKLRHYWEAWHGELYRNRPKDHLCGGHTVICPYGKVGDKLWLRETWAAAVQDPKGPADCLYRADDNRGVEDLADVTWKPSIHMPRRYCQTVLTINALRVERLQAITDQDALSEGVLEWFKPRAAKLKNAGIAAPDRPRFLFELLWTSLYGQAAWDSNPYVWVIQTDKVNNAG